MVSFIAPGAPLDPTDEALLAGAALNDYERRVLESAAYFTVIRGRRIDQRTRTRHPTLREAVAACPGDGRSMIYAVTADGRDAHIRNA